MGATLWVYFIAKVTGFGAGGEEQATTTAKANTGLFPFALLRVRMTTLKAKGYSAFRTVSKRRMQTVV
jgi:hypothetical protein